VILARDAEHLDRSLDNRTGWRDCEVSDSFWGGVVMRRKLIAGALVSMMMGVMLVTAPAASAAGDKFAGMWRHTSEPATWEITPVGEGVFRIEESWSGICAGGPAVVVDVAAVAVGDVLTVNWVTTECAGGPTPVGTVFPGRTITIQEDGSAFHLGAGPGYTMVRTTTEFFDVEVNRYYTDAVTWLACEGITTGTSPTSYRPGDPVTRAQMATFLWRYDGRPEPASLDTAFTDVAAGAFYAKAVAWLSEEMITTGTSPTTFSPSDSVTRAQMATFLWRYSDSPEPASLDTAFTDVVAGTFYAKAVA
jgi:hypothetical protein